MRSTARWWRFTKSGSASCATPSRTGWMIPPTIRRAVAWDGPTTVLPRSGGSRKRRAAAASASESGRRANAEVLADESGFIDLPASPLWLAHEYPQINPGPEPLVARPKSSLVKLHHPIRHPASRLLEPAQTYWRTVHGPLVRPSLVSRREPALASRSTATRSPLERAAAGRTGNGSREIYTGHAEVWSDQSAPRRGPEARAAGRVARGGHEARFIDFARSTFWIGKEHVLIDRWY